MIGRNRGGLIAAAAVAGCLFGALLAPVTAMGQDPPAAKVLIAYGSYKDRPRYPTATFYEHDGQASGRIVGTIPPANVRSDSHPQVSLDGRHCAITSERENETSRILLWDRTDKQWVDLPLVNDSPNSQQHSVLSGDGRLLCFAAWNRPGSSNRWDVLLYDIGARQFRASPWNTPSTDERMPALDTTGSCLALVSPGEDGPADIQLWDTALGRELPIHGLNSPSRDVEPALSGDGNLIAFVSDRPGGSGGRDVYLYDRRAQRLVDLPGLNSVAHEQMPSISADGRYLVFVSERRSGPGERDIYLYDRVQGRLLPTPDLNSPREEIDPFVMVLPVSP